MQRGKRRTAEVLLYFELPFQQKYGNSDWLPTHQSVNKKVSVFRESTFCANIRCTM